MKFKIGDRVRFKKNQDWRNIEHPSTYIVVEVDAWGEYLKFEYWDVDRKRMGTREFFSNRFELVSPKPKIENDPEYEGLFI